MRRQGLILVCALLVAFVAATAARAHSTPKIRAQQAHARAVVAEINQIGVSLEGIIQAYDGAKLKLTRVESQLHHNEARLVVARANFRAAQKRVMERLYSLYVNGRPNALDVLSGAKSLSQVIDRLESEQVLSNQDAALGRQALRFELAVQHREHLLKQLQRVRAATVAHLASRRQTIQSALSRQQRLLASIHSSIQQLQAQEARHEQALKLAAERRLQEQLAAERTAQARTKARSGGIVVPPIVTPPGTGNGSGHPQAAEIALQYLGVPYVWGGASPSGFDCSGLVMYVYAQLGISLPHYTVSQFYATSPISTSQMQPGDLVFFDGLGHVGIYIGNDEFVDAPHTGAVVRIDSLSGWAGTFDGARRVP